MTFLFSLKGVNFSYQSELIQKTFVLVGLESDLAQSKPNRTHHSTQLSNTRFSSYNEKPQRDSIVCNDELSKVQTIICDTCSKFVISNQGISIELTEQTC